MFRLLLTSLLVIVVFDVCYLFLTRVTFQDQRAQISPTYCRFTKPKVAFTKPVIFLPGIKGSLLERAGNREWLTLRQTLTNTPPWIYKDADASLQGVGIFTRLALIPGLLEYAPYQRITAALACNPNAYFFSYDWRRPPMEHVVALRELVARVQEETGQKPSIVAHSMGGLITHAYMKTSPDTVDRVVYVGVPFQPGPGFLPDIDQGSAVGRNKTILSKEAVFSHPSSFVLLPHTGSTLYKGQDLMQLETWKQNMLSIFRDGMADEKAFEQTLNDARAFQKLLDTPASLSNRFMFVVGNCQDTVKAVRADGTLSYEPGDKRVLETAAYPVEKDQLTKEVFVSCAPHDQQLSNQEVVQKITSFLQAP